MFTSSGRLKKPTLPKKRATVIFNYGQIIQCIVTHAIGMYLQLPTIFGYISSGQVSKNVRIYGNFSKQKEVREQNFGKHCSTTCSSCRPPDLNLVVTNFMFCLHVK